MSQPPSPEIPPSSGGGPGVSTGGSSGSGSGYGPSGSGSGGGGLLPVQGQRVEPMGDLFEHYRIFRREDGSLWELGHGSMGVTYKAVDTNLDALVALKIINAQFLGKESSRQRFRREARAAASLRHRNVSSVYHLGQSGQNFFYAMEFVDGATVEALVKRDGPFPWRRALSITLQVTRALMAANAKGLVHRDIKPLNVMVVDEVDEKDVAKLIDFGLAKSAAEEEVEGGVTNASGFLGTPLYSSPEQCEELPADIRSDIYSLGITLWYMLTGEPTFQGNLARVFQQQLHAEPPWDKLPADLPRPVVTLLESMLAKDRANRPQTPADLRTEIERCLEAPSVPTADAPPLRKAPPPTPDPNKVRADKPESQVAVITKRLANPRDPLNLSKKKTPPDVPPTEVPPPRKDTPPPLPTDGGGGGGQQQQQQYAPPGLRSWITTPLGLAGIGCGALTLLLVLGVVGYLWLRPHPTPYNENERHKDDLARTDPLRQTPTPTPAVTPPGVTTPTPANTTGTPDASRLPALLARARELIKAERGEAAAAAWDAVLAISRDSVEGHVERGNAYYFVNDYTKARADFNAATLLTPADARDSLYQCVALLRLDRDDEARRLYGTDGSKFSPQDALDHYLVGSYFLRSGDDVPRAITEYTEAIRLDAQDVRSLNNRGAAYNGQAKYDLAIKDFDAALKINPRAWLVLYARGNAYYEQDQTARAIQDFDAALLINPNDSATCNQRGLAYNALSQFQRAIQDFDASIRLAPKGWAAYANRAYAYGSLNQYQRALQDLDEAARLNPKTALPSYYRGLVYGEMKQYDKAIKEYDDAIRLYAKNPSYFYYRGNAYAELKQPLRAITDYNEAIRLNPKATAYFNNRGNAYDSLGKSQQSLADYNEAVRLDAKNPVAYFNRGCQYVKTGQTERGIADLDESLRLNPKNATVHSSRGWANIKLRRSARAIEDFNQALKLDPNLVDAYNGRATAEEALTQVELAARDRDKARMLQQQKTP